MIRLLFGIVLVLQLSSPLICASIREKEFKVVGQGFTSAKLVGPTGGKDWSTTLSTDYIEIRKVGETGRLVTASGFMISFAIGGGKHIRLLKAADKKEVLEEANVRDPACVRRALITPLNKRSNGLKNRLAAVRKDESVSMIFANIRIDGKLACLNELSDTYAVYRIRGNKPDEMGILPKGTNIEKMEVYDLEFGDRVVIISREQDKKLEEFVKNQTGALDNFPVPDGTLFYLLSYTKGNIQENEVKIAKKRNTKSSKQLAPSNEHSSNDIQLDRNLKKPSIQPMQGKGRKQLVFNPPINNGEVFESMDSLGTFSPLQEANNPVQHQNFSNKQAFEKEDDSFMSPFSVQQYETQDGFINSPNNPIRDFNAIGKDKALFLSQNSTLVVNPLEKCSFSETTFANDQLQWFNSSAWDDLTYTEAKSYDPLERSTTNPSGHQDRIETNDMYQTGVFLTLDLTEKTDSITENVQYDGNTKKVGSMPRLIGETVVPSNTSSNNTNSNFGGKEMHHRDGGRLETANNTNNDLNSYPSSPVQSNSNPTERFQDTAFFNPKAHLIKEKNSKYYFTTGNLQGLVSENLICIRNCVTKVRRFVAKLDNTGQLHIYKSNGEFELLIIHQDGVKTLQMKELFQLQNGDLIVLAEKENTDNIVIAAFDFTDQRDVSLLEIREKWLLYAGDRQPLAITRFISEVA